MAMKHVVETKHFVNPNSDQIKMVISEEIEKVENGSRKRKIPQKLIDEVVEDIFTKKIGAYMLIGGYVAKSYKYPAKSTEAKICWAWRKNKLTLHYDISRSYAKKRSYGGDAEKEELTLEECYRELYPERWKKYCRYMLIRELRKYGVRYFPDQYQFSVNDDWKIVDGIDGCVLLTIDGGNENFVATNVGWIKLFPLPRSLRAACVKLGFNVANKNQINVKEIEDYAIMKALEEA